LAQLHTENAGTITVDKSLAYPCAAAGRVSVAVTAGRVLVDDAESLTEKGLSDFRGL